MSDIWIKFLNGQGATFNQKEEINFNQPVTGLDKDLYLTDLSWLGLIEVSGEDREPFLQGQVTNDILAVTSSASQLSGFCTPKGRLRALFHIFSRQSVEENKLYLQFPIGLIENNLKRLQMFVMMSKVELKDASKDLIKIGVAGSQGEQLLQEQGLAVPGDHYGVTQTGEISVIRLAGKTPRFECIGTLQAIQALWESLKPTAKLLDSSQWKLLDIHAGIPNVYPETSEMFIPQMLNLQAINGVSFKKGCYTGQEVVARMQYLGKLKRHMYIAHSNSNTLPVPGDPLHSPASSSAQGDGNIVDAQPSPQGGVDMLVVVTNDAFESQTVFLDEAQQKPLSFLELPYSFAS